MIILHPRLVCCIFVFVYIMFVSASLCFYLFLCLCVSLSVSLIWTQMTVLHPGLVAPHQLHGAKNCHIFVCLRSCVLASKFLEFVNVGSAAANIQGHLFLQELPNDANHHHFPISDPSVCFYQFVSNAVWTICYKLSILLMEIGVQ